MRATKYTLRIEIEALSKDCFRYLIQEALGLLEDENDNVNLRKDDGDSLKFGITKTDVEF